MYLKQKTIFILLNFNLINNNNNRAHKISSIILLCNLGIDFSTNENSIADLYLLYLVIRQEELLLELFTGFDD